MFGDSKYLEKSQLEGIHDIDEIGDYISVSCEKGKLIITPDVEKEQLHAQFVAERSAGKCL